MVEVPNSKKASACLAFYLPDLSFATQSLSLLPRDRDTLIQVQAAGLDSIATDLAQVLRVRYRRDPVVLSEAAAEPPLDNPQFPQVLETVEILIQIIASPFSQAVDTEAHQKLCQLAAAHTQLGILLMVGGEPCPPSPRPAGESNVVMLSADSSNDLVTQAAQTILDLLTYSRLLARSQRWLNQYKPPYLLLNQRDMKAVERWQQTLVTSACRLQVQLTDLQHDFLSASQQALTTQMMQAGQPNPPEVFISYSRRDTSVVKKLHRLLIHKGVRLWVDWENIPVASDWWAEIEEALQTVHTLIFFISSYSIKSKYCRLEVDLAQRLQKRIVPVLLNPEVQEHEIHPYARRHQHLAFTSQNSPEEIAEQLCQTLQTDLEHVKVHTRLSNQAMEWSRGDFSPDLLLRGTSLAKAQRWLVTSQAKAKEPTPTELHKQYIRESDRLHRRRRSYQLGILVGLPAVLLLSVIITIFAVRSGLKNLIASISNQEQGMETLVSAIYAGRDIKQKELLFPLSGPTLRSETTSALQREMNNLQEKNRLEGHEGTVYKVLFPGDTGKLISAGADSSIRIWPLEKDENLPEPRSLENHEKDVVAIDVSPDGQLLASGSYDGQVLLWDVRKNQLQKELRPKSDQKTFAVAFNSLGNALAAGGEDGNAYLWHQTNDFTAHKALSHGDAVVLSLNFTPDGKQLATADSTGKIKLWDLDGNLLQELNHGSVIVSMVFTKAGQQLVSGGFDGSIRIWDLVTGEWTALTGPKARINQLAISPDKQLLAAASIDNTITVWRYSQNSKSFELLRTLTAHTAPVFRVEFASNGRFLATGGAGGQINLWGINERGEQINFLYALQGHTNDVLSLAFNPGSTELASSSRDGSIRIWNLQETLPSLHHDNDVLDVVIHPESGDIITTGVRNIRRWASDTYTSKEVVELSGNIFTVDYSPDGAYLITGADNGQLRLFKDAELGNQNSGLLINQPATSDKNQLQIHSQGVTRVRFRPSEEGIDRSKLPVFASLGYAEQFVYIWDINGKLIDALEHQHPVKTLSWSRDGTYLVTSSQPINTDPKDSKSLIQVWQMSSTSEGTLQSNRVFEPWDIGQTVVSVKFNPASTDYELLVVKENGVPEIRTLEGKLTRNFKDSIPSNAKITAADVNATGSLLSTLDDGGYVTFWNIRNGINLYSNQLHKGLGWTLRFHPTERYKLVTGGVDDRAVIVNLPEEVETKALELALSKACKLAEDYLQVGSIQAIQSQNLRSGQLQAARTFCAEQNSEN